MERGIFCLEQFEQTVHMAAGCFQTQVWKAERSAYDETVYRWQHNPSLRVVKCFDSKQSPFWPLEGAQPADSVKELGQKNVQLMYHAHSWLQPTVQQVHGSSGTLGCGNALIGLYRIKLRCKKYYQRIFFHFVDTVVGNTWLLDLLYLNHCNDVGLQESKQLCLLELKYFISPALAEEGRVVYTKRVRLSILVEEIFTVKNWKDTTQQHKWFRRKLWETTM